MKKFWLYVVICALCMLSAVGYSLAGSAPGTGIVNTMHDMNALAGFGYTPDQNQRVCIFCHTPDNQSPLTEGSWSHALSSVQYEPYFWTDPANMSIPVGSDPLYGVSRLCMGCHDGVTAVDGHDGVNGEEPQVGTRVMTAQYVNQYGNVVKRYIDDLTVTHPMGFIFTDALETGANLKPGLSPDSTYLGNSSVTIGSRLDGGFMTCSTCHEVHNDKNTTSGNWNYYLIGGPKKSGPLLNLPHPCRQSLCS